jgi:hypothetical protein
MGAGTQFSLLLLTFLGVLLLCTKPLGSYIADVMDGRPNFALRAGSRIEGGLYRLCGIRSGEEMNWQHYAIALLLFNVLGALIVYGLQRLQLFLPLNPQNFPAVSADSSFNTAVSFITNTNWQGYAGESTMGYLVQMAGLAVQNFLSAATGIAVAMALIRGFVRHSAQTIGNFWVDVTRATLYVLLPLSVLLALVLSSQGVIQNLAGYKDATTIEKLTYQNPKTDAAGSPIKDAAGNPVTETASTQTQTLAMGPIASQEAIKELGTNGGGFFNANSAHLELARVVGHVPHRVRPHLHIRQDGGGYPTGLGAPGGDADPVRSAGDHRVPCRTKRQSAHCEAGRRSSRESAAGGRQHGGQGDPLRHRCLHALGGGRDRNLHGGGQLGARLDDAPRRLRADVLDAAR